jgi:riboflavin biosynthesis pyrimidine reductase
VTDLGVRLEPLFDAGGSPPLPLTPALEDAFGGPFALPDDVVYANFVVSIDGVAAIEGVPMSSATISGAAAADRLMMALLRGVADAVVVGAGTLREHKGPWTAQKAFPPGSDDVGRMRADLTKDEAPTLVVVTARGNLPPDHPSLRAAIVVTTSSGARNVAERGVPTAEVIDVGETDDVDARSVIDALRERGHRRILSEGGPALMGSMLEAGVVEELFLTISPKLIGGGEERPPFTGAADLLELGLRAEVRSVRRAGDYLFLRYALTPSPSTS